MKKILLLMLCMIFLVGTVSAVDWDNVKRYDEERNTITIINAFNLPFISRDIATIQLNTPIDYLVPRGYQKVAEFTIDSFDDKYINAFKKMEFYDLRKDGEKFERDFDYKYKTLENVEINKYRQVCDTSKTNETEANCRLEFVKVHIEQKEVWRDLNSTTLLKGKITIGIFTDVQKGDKVEWLPTLFGVRIGEWAEWTENLHTDLVSYYKLDEQDTTGSGTIIDEIGVNGINVGADNTTGKINTAYDFNGVSDYINLTNRSDLGFEYNEPFSVSLWTTGDTTSGQAGVIGKKNDLDHTGKGWMMFFTQSGRLFFMLNSGTSYGDNELMISTTALIVDGSTLKHIVVTYNGSSASGVAVYVNNETTAIDIAQDTLSATIINTESAIMGAAATPSPYYFDGKIDEVGMWSRELSSAEVTQLYNEGNGLSFPLRLVVTLISPIDTANLTTQTVNFSTNVTDFGSVGIQNVSLVINGAINQTNDSGIEGFYNWIDIGFVDGNHNWTVIAYDDANELYETETRDFNINTTPHIQFEDPTPINYYNSSSSYVPVNVSLTETYFKNITFSFYNNTLTEFYYEDNTRFINKSLADGIYSYNVTVWTTTGQTNSTETRNITIDTTPPEVILLAPPLIIDLHLINTNLSVNWSANDTHIDTCILQFEGVNTTVTCSDNQTEINITNIINRSIIFYVNDTFGHMTSISRSWDYTVFENSQTFNSETFEGVINTFIANVTIIESNPITIANLIYDGTSYSNSFSQSGNDSILTIDFLVPEVDTNTNLTFFWSLTLLDSQIINLTSHNQTIIALSLDDCSTNTIVLYNYTVVDEGNQSLLGNTTTELNINLLDIIRQNYIVNFSKKYSKINPFAVCINKNLSSSTYIVDSIVKYEATAYVVEYYNIVNATITNSTIPVNITLYDLFSADATEFKITFKAEDFTFVENALIYIDRQYIAENNTFKTVELPKTDSNGQTVGHFVRNDVVYNIRVIKGGVVLGNFKNIIAFCEDYTIGACQMILEAIPRDLIIFEYDEQLGIIFQTLPTYNENTSSISFDFSTNDGSIKTVLMEVIRDDIFGNRSICNYTLTSSSGTLICSFDPNIDDSVLRTSIFVEGQPIVLSSVRLESSDYGNLGYVLWFFLTFFFVLLFGHSKTEVLIGLAISFIGAISLGITRGDIIGLGSAGIWVLLIIILGIVKLNRDKPQ